jgi:hypothetical protein
MKIFVYKIAKDSFWLLKIYRVIFDGSVWINAREYRIPLKMENPEKLATLGTQDDKANQKHNTICVGHHYAQTNINNVYKTTGGKDELNSFIFCSCCGNRKILNKA